MDNRKIGVFDSGLGGLTVVREMQKLMPEVKSMEKGLKESYDWYKENRELVRVKPLIQYIDEKIN